ncbi:6-aminohexanoate-dimer hydrolase [Variovorax sp. SRS16]|uniref:serine hydrolase domain-containing protein n=1 Tax=Variovorax sp. SRS16 TaxID=282217 RepID=UPI001319578A|nr:serine hydrolase [Variovorax sp. SRS16]VTU28306.1 6-aminohexanoate-dimer hydrolase [Variovorax sp. SRS16]
MPFIQALLRSIGAALLLLASAPLHAAPDEDALGKAAGYPVARTRAEAFREPYLVGSFSAMDRVGPHCTLSPSADPLPLRTAAGETVLRYRFRGQTLSLDDYMQRQRATAVLVLKDGEIVAERYNYGRTAGMRMLSNSMAKTLVALAVGKALEEGAIRSLDDTAATYAPALAGTLYGETRIVNLMHMASGAQYVEDYSGFDDFARFNRSVSRLGAAAAARTITQRAAPQGERFNYASSETAMLGLVLRGATGQSLCDYVERRIWQPMGAEAEATWLINPVDGVEYAGGSFNATPHDYARLGWLLANDGELRGKAVVPREYLLDMTEAARQPERFRPGRMPYKGSTYLGYGLQTWLMPGSHRRFVLLGVYGQAIFVDPELKLVLVHLAVGKDASGDASGNHLGAERDALWRGIVAHYGAW